ncbi:hypothetical protein Goklo_024837 [Gossypium klotzschianum]|uniref:Uncharacterized protein n=1 Tax=Gossypium klotzschianum TaxID=34286 RepID=A0A7J8W3Z7_9ROSI|nr:hypothetical protein [Gossypium klotzschianum]
MKYLSTPFIDRTILTNSSLTEEVITSLREAAARVLGPYPPPGPDFPPPPTPVGYSRTHRSPSPPQPGYQGYCYEGYPSSSPGLLPPRLPPRNEYTHNGCTSFLTGWLRLLSTGGMGSTSKLLYNYGNALVDGFLLVVKSLRV